MLTMFIMQQRRRLSDGHSNHRSGWLSANDASLSQTPAVSRWWVVSVATQNKQDAISSCYGDQVQTLISVGP